MRGRVVVVDDVVTGERILRGDQERLGVIALHLEAVRQAGECAGVLQLRCVRRDGLFHRQQLRLVGLYLRRVPGHRGVLVVDVGVEQPDARCGGGPTRQGRRRGELGEQEGDLGRHDEEGRPGEDESPVGEGHQSHHPRREIGDPLRAFNTASGSRSSQATTRRRASTASPPVTIHPMTATQSRQAYASSVGCRRRAPVDEASRGIPAPLTPGDSAASGDSAATGDSAVLLGCRRDGQPVILDAATVEAAAGACTATASPHLEIVVTTFSPEESVEVSSTGRLAPLGDDAEGVVQLGRGARGGARPLEHVVRPLGGHRGARGLREQALRATGR